MDRWSFRGATLGPDFPAQLRGSVDYIALDHGYKQPRRFRSLAHSIKVQEAADQVNPVDGRAVAMIAAVQQYLQLMP